MSEQIEFGLKFDGTQVFQTYNDLKKMLTDIRDTNAQLSKDIQSKAEIAANSEKAFTTLVGESNKELEQQKDIFKQLKKYLDDQVKAGGQAFKADTVNAYNKALKESENLLNKLGAAGKKGILSPEEVKKLTSALNSTNNEFEALQVILDVTKGKLKTLVPDTQEYQELSAQIQVTEAMLAAFTQETEQNTGKQQNLRQELKNVTLQLAELKAQGKDNTVEYDNLKNKAGELFDTLSDVKEELRQAGSDTAGFDKLIRLASVVTGSFQIAQGAMAIFGEENEDVQKAILKVNAAMSILNGLQAIQTELTKADSLAKTVGVAIQKAWTAAIAETATALGVLKVALIASGIGVLLIAIAAAVQWINQYNEEVKEQAERQKKVNEELEKTKNLLNEVAEDSEKERNARKGGLNDKKRELELLEAQGASEKKIAAQKQKIIDDEIQNLKIRKYTLEGFAKEQADIEEQIKDKTAERVAIQYSLEKKLADDRKKTLEKYASDVKKLNQDITNFIRQEEENRVAAITDANERERAENILAFEKEIANLDEAYKTILSTQVLTAEQRKEVQESYEKQVNDIAAKYGSKALEIDEKHKDEKLKIAQDAATAILDLQSNSRDKEIAEVDKKYSDIIARLKKAGLLTVELEKEIAEKANRERELVNDKYKLAAIDAQEDLEIAKVSIITDSKYSPAAMEEIKQREVLKVQLKYAKLRLEALEKSGGKENELAIAQTRALISGLENNIRESSSKDSPISMLLGTTDSELMKSVGAAESITNSVLDVISQGIRRKLELKQEEIAQMNDKIDDLEKSLEKELDLQKQGYANNVDEKRKELAELKKQRDKDLALQKEHQKDLEKVEIAKQAAALATSTANMILTVSKVFSSLTEKFGWVGALIAVAEAAGVVASFVSLRNQIRATQKLSKGGIAGGDSHANGGNKYVSLDGKDSNIVEIEQGEFVTNKASSHKYRGLLEDINNDNVSGWVVDGSGKLVKSTAIRYNKAAYDKAVRQDNAAKSASSQQANNTQEYLSQIAETNKRMLEIEQDKGTTEDFGSYMVITKGNKKRIIRK